MRNRLPAARRSLHLAALLPAFLAPVSAVRLADQEDIPVFETSDEDFDFIDATDTVDATDTDVTNVVDAVDVQRTASLLVHNGNEDKDVWKAATGFMKTKGVSSFTDGLKQEMTYHSGNTVRGIVAAEDLPKEKELLRIPKKLWLTLDNFPDIRDAPLECGPEDGQKELRMVTAIAREQVKGQASDWYGYLNTLPSKDDFTSFYPKWMKEDVMKEFKSLMMVKQVKLLQQEDGKIQTCWDKWKSKTTLHGFSDVAWDDVLLAKARWSTRNHNISGSLGNYSHALLPAADLMNTGPLKSLNTVWGFWDLDGDGEEDAYILTTKNAVRSGEELYESYCPKCTNHNMLLSWGVYVEDNAVDEVGETVGNCESAMKAADKYLNKENWPLKTRAPRCKKEVKDAQQGPLRCSLSRLVWETCKLQDVQENMLEDEGEVEDDVTAYKELKKEGALDDDVIGDEVSDVPLEKGKKEKAASSVDLGKGSDKEKKALLKDVTRKTSVPEAKNKVEDESPVFETKVKEPAADKEGRDDRGTEEDGQDIDDEEVNEKMGRTTESDWIEAWTDQEAEEEAADILARRGIHHPEPGSLVQQPVAGLDGSAEDEETSS
eukprot:TRINITY_DN123020_c0_g1_i1.p1 TRINITY_DN123020_c0_g1~~TRINITY_DN123020_c0_g1_i1.p1  ORF type:complete len:603 (+),score=173.38 TRINITY_DN123020_c0_g1_i1:117-1925(+)